MWVSNETKLSDWQGQNKEPSDCKKDLKAQNPVDW